MGYEEARKMFEKYVERREHCKAIPFKSADQAIHIASLFNATSWSVLQDNSTGELRLDITRNTNGGPKDITINKGDFIREPTDYHRICMDEYDVVPAEEFMAKFEPLGQ